MCVLAPVRNVPVLCLEWVARNSGGSALSIRSGLDHLKFLAEIEGENWSENEAKTGEVFGLKPDFRLGLGLGLALGLGLRKWWAEMERLFVELASLARLLCSVVIAPELR